MQSLPVIIYSLQYLHKHIIMFARRLYGHPNKEILREILNVILLMLLKEYLSKDLRKHSGTHGRPLVQKEGCSDGQGSFYYV